MKKIFISFLAIIFMKSTVYFDIDRVLLEANKKFYSAIRRQALKYFKERYSECSISINENDINENGGFISAVLKKCMPYGISEKDVRDTYDRAVSKFVKEKDIGKYINYNKDVFEMVKELTHSGYKLGILSNGSAIAQRKKLKKFTNLIGYNAFDRNFIIISSEVGVLKPHNEIYKLAESRAKSAGSNRIIFVDDKVENLEGALNSIESVIPILAHWFVKRDSKNPKILLAERPLDVVELIENEKE